MKRKRILITTVVLLAVILTGCRPAVSTDEYNVINIFNKSKTFVYERIEDEKTIEIIYDVTVEGNIVSTKCVIEFDYGQYRSESTYNADTLIPVNAYKGNSYNLDPSKNWDINAEYGVTLIMTAKTPEGDETKVVELPERYIDNEALLFTVGALTLEEDFKKNINISMIDAGEIVTFQISVVGKEQIEVPYGTINCLKVEIKYNGLVLGFKPKMYIWYSDDENRTPIMHENSGVLLKLISVS